jgi:uncharacterized protein
MPLSSLVILPQGSHPDHTALFGVAWLAEGKFYGLFSLLFGVGFAIQMDRWKEQIRHPALRFTRRLGGLLVLGLAHGLLLWMGDILAVYAVMGLFLMAFRRCRPRTLLVWAVGLLAVWAALWGALGLATVMGQLHDPGGMAAINGSMDGQARADVVRSLAAYGHGPWSSLFHLRAGELLTQYFLSVLGFGPHILAMMLLGLWSWRTQVFTRPGTTVNRWLGWGLAVGLPGSLACAWCGAQGMTGAGMSRVPLAYAIDMISAPALTLGYAGLLLAGLRRPQPPSWLRILRWPGRMALTNYLMQTVVMTSVFYFYGLGLFGRVRYHWTLLLAVALWLVQIPLSRAWLSRFRFGPVEWLWRAATYGRRP